MNLPFRITICGLDELAGHCEARVSHVLSILDPAWPEPTVFETYGEHRRLELRFHDVIEERADVVAPGPADVGRLLDFGRELARAPRAEAHLLVHCHAGVSRSSASVALLIARAMPEAPGAAVFAEILRIRPQVWPNLRIIELGDAALGRGGDLVAGAAGVYRWQLTQKPFLAEEFRANSRGREVEAALGG
ncbi:MAG: protein-tyrosine-phosphatase [Acetobacteraceae bacterium]|nr:protein-tyrosine-phosphatase [Acetobacteraceae bacterium]